MPVRFTACLKGFDLLISHHRRMANSIATDVSIDPMEIRLLSAISIVPRAQLQTDLVEEFHVALMRTDVHLCKQVLAISKNNSTGNAKSFHRLTLGILSWLIVVWLYRFSAVHLLLAGIGDSHGTQT